jgi:SPP1 family predicted phage head-tail adaptor
MRSGRLRHRVTIQRPSVSTNARGQKTTAYDTLATVWAEVKPLMGRELERAQQIHAETRIRVRMRATDVTPRDRLIHDDRVLEILSVIDPLERGAELVIDCREHDDISQ